MDDGEEVDFGEFDLEDFLTNPVMIVFFVLTGIIMLPGFCECVLALALGECTTQRSHPAAQQVPSTSARGSPDLEARKEFVSEHLQIDVFRPEATRKKAEQEVVLQPARSDRSSALWASIRSATSMFSARGQPLCCAVCLEAMEDGEAIGKSNACTHVFHEACITEWLHQHDECPVCRRNYLLDSV